MLPPDSQKPEATAQILKLSRFRSDVAHSLARRGRALVESDNLATEVPEMAPVELYYVIKELGVDEAAPILLAATAEQFTALCDLDCWDGDDFLAEELDAWLAPLMAESHEALAETFLLLDDEVQVLFLQASLRVLDNREQDGTRRKTDEMPWPADIPEDAPWKTTPEGFFTLIDVSQDREVPPFVLVDALMNHDANEGFRLLTAARWELVSPLMEQGRHFRDGRMLDLGFCGPDEALRLFAAPPPLRARPASDAGALPAAKTPQQGPVPSGLPALYAEQMVQVDCAFLRAMAEITDTQKLADLELQLVVLINAAVVGYGHAPKEVARVAEVARWVRDTLSLGLEASLAASTPALAGAQLVDDEALGEVLADTPLLHLFQRGVAQVRPLQQQARRLVKQPHVEAWLGGAPLDNDHDPQGQARAFLRALADTRPLWGGQVSMRPEQKRAWQNLADVAAAQAQLNALEKQLGPG